MPDILKILVNASLLFGLFPSSQRHALVTPVLKKPHLDPSIPNSYRPISNLSFVSKLLERVVARQLTTHLESNGLIPALQSAYRRNHSTETALLKTCNDALMAADNGIVTLVVLLDYSAAFDTVDHSIMLDLLERRCGLTDDALRWRTSYLHCRSYAIVSGGATSETVELSCGLPQGSSLGPLKFVVYAADLHAVTRHHNVSYTASLTTHNCTGTQPSKMCN